MIRFLIALLILTGTFTTVAQPSAGEEAPLGGPAEEMPVYPGGEKELMKYVRSIKYPQEAKEKGIEGKVFVRFVVDTAGKVTNVQTIRDADPVLAEAAIEHIKNMPDWTPGKQRGKKVNVYYTVPINFSLGKEDEKKSDNQENNEKNNLKQKK